MDIDQYYYMYVSKYDIKMIEYLDSCGFEKEIGDTIVYKIFKWRF